MTRAYTQNHLDENPIIYCSVEFEENGVTYDYLTEDDSICVGETVIVPVGKNNKECKATVVEKRYFQKDDVPYPVEKTKK